MDYAEIVRIGCGFDGVVEAVTYGTPSLKVGKAFLLRLREPGILALRRTGLDERDMLIEADPEMFFITDHYRDYPYVLARLDRLTGPRFAALFEPVWRQHALKRWVAAYDARAGA